MKQSQIMALLVEASYPKCSETRLHQIAERLQGASPNKALSDGNSVECGKVEGLRLVVNSLYFEALEGYRDQLPSLFPVFAMLCGDRPDNSHLADIDWSVMVGDRKPPKKAVRKKKGA